MSMTEKHKQTILIVDDSDMNRSLLADMLGDEYGIIEADDGDRAVEELEKNGLEISLVLLDIVMSRMDGFEVLTEMNRRGWIEDIPVIMISSEDSVENLVRAYNLGVTDFIARPFIDPVVHRRVVNTLLLYAKQKKLVNMVADQIYEKEQHNTLMIDILSHIVEFRNGESGMHVIHVRTLTELLLQELVRLTPGYPLTQAEISMIGTASALHDIGKIAIPEEILNKPGRFTDEEFAKMKTHSAVGSDMLEKLPFHQEEPLVKIARDICRWHHERYDGRGYPDGLKGDEIPISAQVVAMADVYDALTSQRVYKPAYSHEKAVQMILEGQCGVFNPLILECLRNVSDGLQEELNSANPYRNSQRTMRNVVQEMQQHKELSASERTLHLLEHERMKYNFFAALTQEIQFEYTLQPPVLTLNAWGAEKMGLGEVTNNPFANPKLLAVVREEDIQGLASLLHSTTPRNSMVSYNCQLRFKGELRWFRIAARAMWSADEPPRYTGAIGKATDIHDSQTQMESLKQIASHDALTGLLNHANAKKKIMERVQERPEGKYALAVLDLDYFKQANDTYGHIFGDEVLKYMAELLRSSVRSGDIVARMGGDEFLIFLEYRTEPEHMVRRVYEELSGGQYGDFRVSVSMGVALTAAAGTDYEPLFRAADQALYAVKRNGRGHYRFYDSSMEKTLV